MSVIFWFSGTGNSLYAAKCAAAELGGIPLVPMATGGPILSASAEGDVTTGPACAGAAGGNGEKMGFVFPSYYGNLPRAVRAFVEKLEVKPGTYLFAIVTMGGVGQGSIAALQSALAKKSLRLDYGRGIHMPANYVIAYNPANPIKCEASLDKAAKRIQRACGEIAAGVRSVKSFKFAANNLYKNIPSLDAKFFVEESCTACGLCSQLCPVGNIQTTDGKPFWQHRCERCVACISGCPARAIQYGSRTKKRRRYQNPRIPVGELQHG